MKPTYKWFAIVYVGFNLAKLKQIDLYKNGEGVRYLDYLSYFIKPQPTVSSGKIREDTFQRKY